MGSLPQIDRYQTHRGLGRGAMGSVYLDEGRLVLADFGIVKAIAEENPLGPAAAAPQTDIIGTPGFMAPEQLEGRALDERTDLFAFGSLLYYLASKEVPFDADSPYG